MSSYLDCIELSLVWSFLVMGVAFLIALFLNRIKIRREAR